MKRYQKVILAGYALPVAGSLLLCGVPAKANTVAYWRFEAGPADGKIVHSAANGVFSADVADSSGNGNALSAWTSDDWAGEAYRTDLSANLIPQTSAANNFSIQNTGGYPGLFTGSAAMRTMTPGAFSIEVSFKPETGSYRTLVGRDSRGAATVNGDLAALYLQIQPDNSVAIKYADVAGYWHEAISAANAITGFAYPDSASGHWYNMAAVSDGSTLSLYLDTDTSAGYTLVAQTDMTISGSPNTALTAGIGSGGDWQAGNWSVGRGLYAGGHGDRAYGFIDEIRISDSALLPSEFLFSPIPEPGTVALTAMGLSGLALLIRRRKS